MISDPNAIWISTARSGVIMCRAPSRWDWKSHAFLTHARQGPETEHLKTPLSGENGGWPTHEGMQAAKAA